MFPHLPYDFYDLLPVGTCYVCLKALVAAIPHRSVDHSSVQATTQNHLKGNHIEDNISTIYISEGRHH